MVGSLWGLGICERPWNPLQRIRGRPVVRGQPGVLERGVGVRKTLREEGMCCLFNAGKTSGGNELRVGFATPMIWACWADLTTACYRRAPDVTWPLAGVPPRRFQISVQRIWQVIRKLIRTD